MAALAVVAEPGRIARIAGLLLHPQAEWRAIARDDTPTRRIFMHFVLPMIGLVSLGAAIGSALFGPQLFGVPLRIGPAQAIGGLAIGYVLMVVTFLLLVMLTDSLAARMNGEATYAQSFKLVAYCTTPTWLILALVGLLPPLRFLLVGVLWSTWLTYLGAGPLLGMTGARAARFVGVMFVAAAVLYAAAAALTLMQFQLVQQMGLLN
jgi:hypothetical protein